MAEQCDDYSDDDFQSKSPTLSQPQIRRNPNIPVGHILAAPKWRNTIVTAKIAESIKVLFSSGLGIVDFYPSGECAVVFISADEMIEEHKYKKRLAVLQATKGVRKIVIGERIPTSIQHFATLQQFAAIELSLNLIPVAENCLSLLLVQMVFAENKMAKNPFLNSQKKMPEEDDLIIGIVMALKNIPKLGEKKIKLLVEKFPSLHKVGDASLEQLEALLGASVAQSVWNFFNK